MNREQALAQARQLDVNTQIFNKHVGTYTDPDVGANIVQVINLVSGRSVETQTPEGLKHIKASARVVLTPDGSTKAIPDEYFTSIDILRDLVDQELFSDLENALNTNRTHRKKKLNATKS